MDKAARALQLAGCIAHTGDVFTFNPGDEGAPILWKANPAAEGGVGGGKLNLLIKTGRVQLTGARSAFDGRRLPVAGDDLTDEAGHVYTVVEAPPEPTNPLLTLICTVSLVTPA